MPRPRRPRPAPLQPSLAISQVLAWAEAFLDRSGRWPTRSDKAAGLPDTTWSAIDGCLKSGLRGLPGGDSLAKLLLRRRGRRHKGCLPRLTTNLILDWADAHHARTGDWPDQYSGPIAGATGESWAAVNAALGVGGRCLPGNSSLAQLPPEQRGVGNHLALRRLSVAQVLTWIDHHHERTVRWPSRDTGPVLAAPTETWNGIDSALNRGRRGLAVLGSPAHLLSHSRGVRHPHPSAPPISRASPGLGRPPP